MNRIVCALLLGAFLSACGGGGTNPITGGGSTGGGDGDGGTTDPSSTVPSDIANNLVSFAYVPGQNTIRVRVTGLDTTPLDAEWQRDARFDLPGYTAFSVQEDPLDRLFVGLAQESADGTVRAAVVGDGGNFNRAISGALYGRTGGFTPPTVTPAQGSGQVSYAGSYAGITNVGNPGGSALQPPTAPVSPVLTPAQPALVRGQIFLNANFADNRVEGAIYDRILLLDAADPGGDTQALQSVILVPTAITSNGGFTGTLERWVVDDPSTQALGTYAGVFGGTGAGNVAGAVEFEPLYLGADGPLGDAGDQLDGTFERGIFVLRQCGLSGDDPLCDTVLPDISNP